MARVCTGVRMALQLARPALAFKSMALAVNVSNAGVFRVVSLYYSTWVTRPSRRLVTVQSSQSANYAIRIRNTAQSAGR